MCMRRANEQLRVFTISFKVVQDLEVVQVEASNTKLHGRDKFHEATKC